VQLRDVVDMDVTTAVNAPLTTIPDAFKLLPNHPNPFNPSTTLRFTLTNDTDVDLSVFDTLGQRVRILEAGSLRAGIATVTCGSVAPPASAVSTVNRGRRSANGTAWQATSCARSCRMTMA